MTFATEHAIPAALIALWGVYSGEDLENSSKEEKTESNSNGE